MLSLVDVSAGYGPIVALKSVSIEVPDKTIVALLGSNGAGKSTTLKSISGLVRPSRGKITFAGKDIGRSRCRDIVKAGVVHCPEGRQIFPRLTVKENLRLGYYLRRDRAAFDATLSQVFAYFPRLEERQQQAGGTLSGGEQQMLAIGRALMAGPKLLMLDEPSLGIAPLVVKEIMHIIQEINASGVSVLLVEQNARLALGVSHYAYVLELGEVVIEGRSNDLQQDRRVQELYLGMREAHA